MTTNFDAIIDRRHSNSEKWQYYPANVLPLWVADMDFAAPEPVQAALRAAVAHGIYGYEFPRKALLETVSNRMEALYGWKVPPEAVIATPGVIAGFTAAAQAFCQPGEGVLIQPPVYPPFLAVQERAGLVRQMAPLSCSSEGPILHYAFDRSAMQAGMNSNGAHTGMFLLCNPHNPTGNVFSQTTLEAMAELCLKNGSVICSDEIHSELLLQGAKHTPIAALSPEIAARSITLVAPSKTFNVPGLFCAFAIIPDPDLRQQFKHALEKMALHVNSLGLVAAQAAYSGECDGWLAELRTYLTQNRDFLVEYVRQHWAKMKLTIPEATYLAWMDCREYGLEPSPHQFFLEKARVALNDGAAFGPGGEGFVRLNFGCPRQTLAEALERMRLALL